MPEPRHHPPILVLLDTASATPWGAYLPEVLAVEGFMAHEVTDLATTPLAGVDLDGYNIVILTSIELDPDAQDRLAAYVEAGGNLIALRPPVALAARFGLRPSEGMVNRRVRDRYLAIEHDHALLRDLPCDSLQFHGTLDLYTPDGAEPLAWVAGELDQPTGFVAVSLTTHGEGRAAVFAYDLCTTVVRQRQGKPENSSTGNNADADGDDRWSPNDLFVDQLDPRLKLIPQADLHQDLLVRLINRMSVAPRRPIPRVWYFPDAAPGVALFNGDSDGMDREDYDTVVSAVERAGGAFTVYLMEEHLALIPPNDEQGLRARGHAFGPHVVLDFQAGVEEARAEVARALERFHDHFGYRPLTNRGHCLIWPGWTEMADALVADGVRMDQNFIPRRYLRHGYLNGSGLPARFIRPDGSLVDLYEQNTHITDDGAVEVDKFLIPGVERQEVLRNALRMLDDCATVFHGVFQAAFHPRFTTRRAMWLLEALVARCRDHGIPMVGGDAWVRFNDARRQVRFDAIAHDAVTGTVTFSVSAGAAIQGLTVMIPDAGDQQRLASVVVGREEVPFERRRFKGTDYGLLHLDLDANASRQVTCRFVGSDVAAVAAQPA